MDEKIRLSFLCRPIELEAGEEGTRNREDTPGCTKSR